jgi:hypothetical protein
VTAASWYNFGYILEPDTRSKCFTNHKSRQK